MILLLIRIVNFLASTLTLIVLADVILSYFMSPWHPFKRALDNVVEPLLSPIRRVVPPLGMIDFSPVVLIIAIQIVQWILVSVLASLL
ncbi:MAG TPA: YggT family protein [Chloroflexi bacterium]|nr:YggT family protein [Chloroflexota bacterium]HPO58819.1 YggT family protein [Anaerolineaceae bacterium]